MHQTLKQFPIRVGLWSALLLCTADCLAQDLHTASASSENLSTKRGISLTGGHTPAAEPVLTSGIHSNAAATNASAPSFAESMHTDAPVFAAGGNANAPAFAAGVHINAPVFAAGANTALPSFAAMAADTSLPQYPHVPATKEASRTFHLTAAGITVPLGLIAIGASGLSKNSPIYRLNHNTAHEIKEDYPHFRTWADDYLRLAPVIATVGLEAAGVKGRHTAAQTSIIAAMSLSIMYGSTEVVKRLAKETRPDGTDDLSFPSGHTATAFASAELMRLEFKDTHPVLAWSGYMAAAATGALRMLKQRHFTGDVVAGAGFGILSTEAAYLVYPVVQRVFSAKSNEAPKMTLLPQYNAQWKTAGVAFAYHF